MTSDLKHESSGASPRLRPPMAVAAALLLSAALGIALYLATHDPNALAGCTAGDPAGCAGILGTKWAYWMSLPVSALGAGSYALALAAVIWVGVSGSTVPGFGRVLSIETIDGSLRAVQEERDAWREAHPAQHREWRALALEAMPRDPVIESYSSQRLGAGQ